jgi:hypothetical protein
MPNQLSQKLFISFILATILGVGLFFYYARTCDDYCQQQRVARVLKKCSNQNNRTNFIACLEKEMEYIFRQTSPRFVNKALVDYYRQQPELLLGRGIYGCHDISHAMGHLTYQYSASLTEAYRSCIPVCAYGCYHGVTEQMIASTGNLDIVTTKTCEIAGETGSRPCYHGVGHGVASMVADPQKSLDYCSLFPQDDYGPELCAYGVFMELFLPSLTNHETLAIPDDLLGFCRQLEGQYGGICLSLAGAHEYLRTGNFNQAALLCQQVPTQDQYYCYVGLGQEVYADSGGDVDVLVDYYQQLESPVKQSFLEGVVEATTWENPFSPSGEALCQQVEQPDQALCWEKLAQFRQGI